MKKGLLYSIIALAAIIIVASFHMQLGITPAQDIPENMMGKVLYVCPVASTGWDAVAIAFRQITNYIVAGFFFCMVLLAFGWGWQLYQNLINDKFKRESFKNIWWYTKIWFWGLVVAMLILFTPNSFRRVSVTGAGDNWVMCDASNPDARAYPADAVHAH